MTLISIPKPLQDRLGEEATESLVSVLRQQETGQKEDLIHIMQDRYERRISESELKIQASVADLRSELRQTESCLLVKISDLKTELKDEMTKGFLSAEQKFGDFQKQFGEIQKQFGEIQKQFGSIHDQFGEVQKQFLIMQRQITNQTKWLIALISFLVVALKLFDLLR